MSIKLVKSFPQSVCYILFIVATLFSNTSFAIDWNEAGDAGYLTNTAQITMGTGALDSITGSIATNYDVDVYKIKISNPTAFSALVSGGEGAKNWDSLLMLFDENGLGVYGNDDEVWGSANASLPAGHQLGPQTAGNYFLAISDDDMAPYGGLTLSTSTRIFTGQSYPYTQVYGSINSFPFTDWRIMLSERTFDDANYSIALTGAEVVSSVPVPSAFWLFGTGIIGFASMRKKAV